MKSTQQQLQQRGLFQQKIYEQYLPFDKQTYIEGLTKNPSIQTVCIRLLSEKYHDDSHFTLILLRQLQNNPPLYTKIEIQKQLAQYGKMETMCTYLGKIGHNQHKRIPAKVSQKKSYPLPRDIVARIIAHMNPNHFLDFIAAIPKLTYSQLLEAVDALGFFCFYHKEVVNENIYKLVQSLLHQYENDELMMWKLTICLSAFPQSINELLKVKSQYQSLEQEVHRSLTLIL